jgi:hypothetical protein
VRALLLATVLGLTLVGCQRPAALAPTASVDVADSLASRPRSEGDDPMKLSGPEAESVAASPATVSSPPATDAKDAKKGRILGKISWNDIDPHTQLVRLNVSLIGDDVENRDVRLGRPDFKIGKGYEIRNVPPGAYRLVAEAGGTPMWDLKVEVPAEKDTTLDLTQSNAVVPKDFKPPTD